jgi:hypothetical protein
MGPVTPALTASFAREQRFVLVEEAAVAVGERARRVQPARGGVDATAAETLVIAHHAGAAERLEEVEDLLTLAERVHQRGAAGAAVLQQEAGEAGVVEEPGQLGEDDAEVFRPLRHGLAQLFVIEQR